MKTLLKVTTDYSLLQSMIQVNDLISFCKEKDITTCGICDTNLFGVIEFYNACISNDIKPLIGLEVSINNLPFYLYAKNYSGYQNLLQLNTIIQQRSLALLDLEMVATNVFAIVPYQSKELYPDLEKIYSNIYIGYKDDYEKKNGLLITSNVLPVKNIKVLKEADKEYLNYLAMIDQNSTIKTHSFVDYEGCCYKDDTDTFNQEKLEEFVKQIDIVFPQNEIYIPKYDCEYDSYVYLVNLAQKGLSKRLNNQISKQYQERLNYELDVIKKMGFVDYFLIVYDYVLFAKKNHILVGVGRGSAAGSLVSYSLGITDVDPIHYNLLFERFLNPDRITMPDIDIDFENTKRDMVISYVKEKYGQQNVAGIMTFGTLKSRLVLRVVAKCLEIDSSLFDKFISLINSKYDLKENLKNEKVSAYLRDYEELKKAYKISMKLENLKRNISTHAAGVVISSKKLDEIIPICINGGEIFTGVTMEYLENLGLLKMDFLAIKNLTTIANILDLIEQNTGKRLNLNTIPLNDEKVLKTFHDANTVGVFQYESTGMTNFLQKLKPTNFEDLIAAIALFRPGPMENIDSFIRRKYKREKIDYIHPDLEDILKETYGIIVYQEQIMQILVKIGGYTFAEADNIRRAMSKKKKEVIDNEQEHFVKNAIKNGYERKLAENIFSLILKFANYGFNKSHSVSYALIGYQMAYLKVYYQAYFFANLLNNVIGVEGKTKEYIDEAKHFDFGILPPDINLSEATYAIEDNNLRMPFGVIKNVGTATVETILEERKNGKFKDFIDFVKRCYGKSVTTKTLQSLIQAGVFDCFKQNKKTLVENIDIIINYASLVADLAEEYVEKPELNIVDEYSEEELRQFELDSYGFYIGNHPASKYTSNQIVKLEKVNAFYNRIIKCAVLIEEVKIIKTKNNEKMAFIDASDETGKLSFVLFASMMDKINQFNKNQLVMIEGKVAKRFDKYQINIINALPINK